MTNNELTIKNIQNRIHILSMRDPIMNKRIINKLTRRLRLLEKAV